ncbi:MAG: LppY/LpqO family protein [Rudaea sp.]
MNTRFARIRPAWTLLVIVGLALGSAPVFAASLDAAAIGKAAGVAAKAQPNGVVQIGWSRSDVPVTVDGMKLSPAAGLGSWAAFAPMGNRAMVMGDTVVFEDEADAAMDAAFAHGLSVTALHNHFFFDQPKVFFMHIEGEGSPEELATDVKAVWDAIKAVRAARPQPADGFGGATPRPGKLDAEALGKIVGHPAAMNGGVAKIAIGRKGSMHDQPIGASMGLTTWAAFSGSDALAAMDGDFIMTAAEVQPVLHALRKAGIHVVALHNHMIGTQPDFYFTHFWGKGKATDLARGFRAALDAQAAAAQR